MADAHPLPDGATSLIFRRSERRWVAEDRHWLIRTGAPGEPELLVPTRSRHVAAWAERLRHPQGHRVEISEGRLSRFLILPQGGSASPAPPRPRDGMAVLPRPDLTLIAVGIREALDEVWWEAGSMQGIEPTPPGLPPSRWLSLFAAAIGRTVLMQALPHGRWALVGGAPTIANWKRYGNWHCPEYEAYDGGVWNPDLQEWQEHYWIEGAVDGVDLIVDLAGDAGGSTPVRIEHARSPRYRGSYKAGVPEREAGRPHRARAVAKYLPQVIEKALTTSVAATP